MRQIALAVVWIVIAAVLQHLLRLDPTIAALVAGGGYALTHVALNRQRFADLTRAETRRELRRKRLEQRSSRGGEPGIALDQSVEWAPYDDLIRRRHLIDAIKLYREQNGVGLKEAKAAIDDRKKQLESSL